MVTQYGINEGCEEISRLARLHEIRLAVVSFLITFKWRRAG